MPRISDKKKKKIIADYIETNSYRETARLNGNISPNTVKNIVNKNEEIALKCAQKKEENTKDILEYMDEIKEQQKEIIDLSLKALKDKLKNPDMFTNVKDIATVYGVIFDKALKSKEMQIKSQNNPDSSSKKVVIINDLPK